MVVRWQVNGTLKLFFTLDFRECIKFSLERGHVLELPIDRGKPDVGDLIDPLEPFHRQLSDLLGGDLGPAAQLDISFICPISRLKASTVIGRSPAISITILHFCPDYRAHADHPA